MENQPEETNEKVSPEYPEWIRIAKKEFTCNYCKHNIKYGQICIALSKKDYVEARDGIVDNGSFHHLLCYKKQFLDSVELLSDKSYQNVFGDKERKIREFLDSKDGNRLLILEGLQN